MYKVDTLKTLAKQCKVMYRIIKYKFNVTHAVIRFWTNSLSTFHLQEQITKFMNSIRFICWFMKAFDFYGCIRHF